MDVRLPDGTIIKGVPDGMSQAELVNRLRASGYDTSKLVGEVPGESLSDKDIIRKGLEMGPVGNALSAFAGRTTELLSSLASRGLDAAGATDVAKKVKQFGEARPTGFDPNATSASIGNFGADMYVAGKAAELGGAAIQGAGKVVPAIKKGTDALGRAVSTFGAESGLPMNTVAQKAIDLGVRTAGAGAAGYLSGEITDPENAGTAAAISAAIPVVGKVATVAGNTAADVVRPFTQKGREQIAGKVIRDAAQNPGKVAATMSKPANSYAPLTLAERTMDPGLASLQRTIANDPKLGPELTAFMERQNADRVRALMGMVEGQHAPDAIRAARQAATAPLYDDIARNFGDTPLNTGGIRRVVDNIMATPRYRTEAVAKEVLNAVQDDAAKGIPRFGSRSDDVWRKTAPMNDVWGARQNIDQRLFGGSGLDAKASAQAAAPELGRIRDSMSTQLAKIPGFKDAEKLYAQFSRKADAADVIMDIAKRGTANTADMFGNPVASAAKLTQALKGIDKADWAKLTADQRRTVQTLAMELQNAAKAATLSKSLGSNTVQNALADNNVRMAIRGAAGILPGGGLLQGVMGAGTSGAQEKVMGLLGQAVMDPVFAARLASTPVPGPILSPGLQGLLARGAANLPARLGAE